MGNIFDYRDTLSEVQAIPVITVREDNDDHALFTFAVPTFKRPDTLRETLDSIINQIGDIKYNIVISDNNPERDDSTAHLILSQYKDIQHLSYYKNSENLHSYGNWNRLVLLCKTKYMILIHDDDVLHEEFLTDICKVLKAFPEATAINTAKKNWDGNDIVWPRQKNRYKIIKNTVYTNFAFFSFQAPSGCLFEVNAIKDTGGFNPVVTQSFDYTNVLLMCMQGKLLLNYDRILVQYRVVNNASSNLSVQYTQIDEDKLIRENLSRLIALPQWYVKFIIWLKTKMRLRNISRVNKVTNYIGYNPAGFPCLVLFKLFEFIHNRIWVDKIHCIGEL